MTITLAPDSRLGTILGQGLGQGLSQGYLQQNQINEGQTAIQRLAQGLQANPNMSLQEQLLAAQQMLQGLPQEQQESAMNAILKNSEMKEKGSIRESDRLNELERLQRQHEYTLLQNRERDAAAERKEELKIKYDELKRQKLEEEEAKSQEAFSTLTTLPNFLKMDDAQILNEAKKLGLSSKQVGYVYKLVTDSRKNYSKQRESVAKEFDKLISEELRSIPKTATGKTRQPYIDRIDEIRRRKQEALGKMDSRYGKVDAEELLTPEDVLMPVDLNNDANLDIMESISKQTFGGKGYFELSAPERELFDQELAKRGMAPPQIDGPIESRGPGPTASEPSSEKSDGIALSGAKAVLKYGNALNPLGAGTTYLYNRLFG